MERVKITIDTDGSSTVAVECVKGKKCLDVSKAIEQALGKTESSKPTPEMYEVQHANKVSH